MIAVFSRFFEPGGIQMNSFVNKALTLIALSILTATALIAAPDSRNDQRGVNSDIGKKIRKELVTLPYYGVFDNLAYKVEGSTVTLYGQVTKPTTKSDAGRRIQRIQGVSRVVNNIEVLPLSPFDDSIRIRTYRTLFRAGGLYRYALGTNPSIHIVVKNGHVTLEGVVSNIGDSRLAYITANSVPGVFSVTNHLRIEGQGAR
jgi:hyperosmotically inducible protein